MQLHPLDPVGARVTDVALDDLADDGIVEVRRALAEHGVLAFADQRIDDDGFLAFLRRLGPLAFTAGETSVDGHPDLNVVSNVGRTTPPKSSWHVDTSYVDVPPAYTALRAVTIPAEGGQTLFSDQRRALRTLAPDVRSAVEGRSIHHVVTGVDPGPGEQVDAWHPVIRPHPTTGRDALYLTAPGRCEAVSGMEEDEARDLVAALLEHSTRPDNVLAHAWAPGDVVVWDNACVLHRADHSAVVGDRVMHRGMVAAYGA